jgi:hypothetical protein
MKKKLGMKATPKCSILAQKRATCSLEAEYSQGKEPSHTKMLNVTRKKEELTLEARSLMIVTKPRTNIKNPTIKGAMAKIFSFKNSASIFSI